MSLLQGIHHVTAICGDPQSNVDFYSGLLGLRLVKKTVNFDDPQSYHLYYGDRFGAPGTLLTFFAWPGAPHGQAGIGEPVSLSFDILSGSSPWWLQRLTAAGIPTQVSRLGGDEAITFQDPDGMQVQLIESNPNRQTTPWTGSGVSPERAISGIHSVTLALSNAAPSRDLYTRELGFLDRGEQGNVHRFHSGDSIVDIQTAPTSRHGRMGAGSIHHVAFRTPDDASQTAWLQKLTALGLSVSPVMDRKYFHSIYFREPGGVLFEIATDGPGMLVDESEQQLGDHLALPSEYEKLRPQLELSLRPIHAPVVTA